MKSKVRAYSLVEITVVLLLTGIVVSIGYLAFTYFNESFFDFQKRSGGIREMSLFHKVIQEDAALCQYATQKGNSLEFQYGDKNRSYQFRQDNIEYRENGVLKDQFKVKATFDGESFQIPKLLNEIIVTIQAKNKKQQEIILYKHYDPYQILYLEK